MKKISLSVAEPCHQNWDEMTPENRGRFCASCQKTVVDFTTMSDRQIADYFKTAVGSTCGRFYNNQLNREINMPANNFSLPKHFFRYTWPAFLLLLQACNGEVDESLHVVGDVLETKTAPMPIAGNILPQITPVEPDTIKFKRPIPTQGSLSVIVTNATQMGDTIAATQNIVDEATEVIDTAIVQLDPARINIDSLKVAGFAENESITKGDVALTYCGKEAEKEVKPAELGSDKTTKPVVMLFPNPVAKGQQLNLQFKAPFTGVYQLYAVSGQIMQTGKIAVNTNQRFAVPTQGCSAGTYFIRLVDEIGEKVSMQKFVVY